jgi:hypothetical protein
MRRQQGENVQHSGIDRERVTGQLTGKQLFTTYAAPGAYELANTTRRDGRQVYVFRSTRYDERTTEGMPTAENVSRYRGSFAVDAAGRIQWIDVAMAYAGPKGGQAYFRVKYVLKKTGDVSVSRPDWTAAALAGNETATDSGDGHSGHSHGG